jgi:hypothetical protein
MVQWYLGTMGTRAAFNLSARVYGGTEGVVPIVPKAVRVSWKDRSDAGFESESDDELPVTARPSAPVPFLSKAPIDQGCCKLTAAWYELAAKLQPGFM